jgi:carbonic anhydrase/acetyltransferase-like protein (isoleucine patch superfamily)
MPIYQLHERTPALDTSAYVAPGAPLIGSVRLHAEASVWFNAVLRADNDEIEVGSGSNIQDGAVLHVDPGCPIRIGERVTIGHQAMIHGCTIGSESLIGMQAILLNQVVIGSHCLVGAGALVTAGTVSPDGSLVLGSPAKVVRSLKPEEIEDLLRAAQSYRERAAQYRAGLIER